MSTYPVEFSDLEKENERLRAKLMAKSELLKSYISLYDTALDFIRAHNLEDLFEQTLKGT